MSAIRFINQFPVNEEFTYDKRIALLRQRKVAQTEEKARNGGANEDDYGLIVQDEFHYELKPNHENGSIYGYKAWTENYCAILDSHPLYCDPLDAFVGKGFLFLERLRPVTCKWNPAYPFDDLKVLFDKYNVISGIDNCHHFTPDLQIGFDLGWSGILKKLKEQRELHDESHHEFYDSEIAVVEAIIRFLKRGAAELRELAEKEQNPVLKQNLIEMAQVNEKTADQPPETFREAIQWMCWFSMLSRTYNRGSAGGQLDEMLRPYYERDIEKGILTDDDAVFYLACLFLQDSRYFQLGGPDVDGKDMTSKISYLCLEAADKINIACNLTIRVHDGLDKEFFKKSVAYLFKNKQGWPRYSSDSALAEGFMKCGYPLELARKRVAAGCHWMCIPGMEYTMNDTVKINLAKVFEVAYYEMMADKTQAPSADKLWEHYKNHLKAAVDATGDGIMHHLKYQTKSQPELILNLFQHGLIEKGVNITDGGANYYNMCVDGSGIAVVADSFAACEQRVDRAFMEAAIAKQVPTDGKDMIATYGTHGYGYLIWKLPRDGFGLFGMADQYAICDPQTDLIFVLNSENMECPSSRALILHALYDTVIANIGDPLPADDAAAAQLADYLSSRELVHLDGTAQSPFADNINGVKYITEPNAMGIEYVTLHLDGNSGVLEYQNAEGIHALSFGMGHNVFAKFPGQKRLGLTASVYEDGAYDCASSAQWSDPNTLHILAQIIDTYMGTLSISLCFKDDRVSIAMHKHAQRILDNYAGYAVGVRAPEG